MVLSPGSRIGSFEITASLGAGGMGEVYRATDTKLGRDVAVKVVSQTFTDDTEHAARFEREAQLLAAPSTARIRPGRLPLRTRSSSSRSGSRS